MTRAKLLLPIAAMVFVAFAGSVAASSAAKRVIAGPGLRPEEHIFEAAGLLLPIPVVNGAFGGWLVIGAVLATLGILAALGWWFTTLASRQADAPWVWFVSAQIIVSVALSFFAVLLSSDVYVYIVCARQYGVFGENPYGVHVVPLHGDPIMRTLLHYFPNPPPPDNYGPLWTLLAGALARLEVNASLYAQVWTQRFLSIVAAVATGFSLWRLLYRVEVGERIRRVGAFAFNPLVLFETAVGGHNDMIMVAFAVWAFAVADRWPLIAGLLFGASISIKYVSAIALPFLVVVISRKNVLTGILSGALAVAVFVLFFRPFWYGASTTYTVVGHGGYFGMSLAWLINYPIFSAGLQNGPAFPGVPSLPLFGQPSWPRVVELGLLGAFFVIAVWSWFRFIWRRDWGELWRTITAFVWTASAMHPWYGLWLSPAMAAGNRWAVYAWWFGALVLLCYPIDVTALEQVPRVFLFAITVAYLIAPIAIAQLKRARA